MCLDDRYKMIDTLIRIETRNDKETRRKSMKLIRTENAVGHVLCHDMTQIIPGVIKERDSGRDILSQKKIFRCFFP